MFPPHIIFEGDCLNIMQEMPIDSVDLVFCSPPYENARTYGDLQFSLKGQDWVDWAIPRYLECVRISRGLVAWVVEGKTEQFRYSATPILLMADLHRRYNVRLRKPPIYKRVGIPGSGGPDWWRNDYEFIICSSKSSKLPWSDNTATGKPPKYGPGGAMSHRLKNGERKHNPKTEDQLYKPPAKANPGNVIECVVGGGNIGNRLAHENEAPFPESLVLPFVLSFCPPGGIVFDPFCGSGTTLDVAISNNRKAIGIDIRESQVKLTLTRTTN